MKINPGDVFEQGGRFFRLRKPREKIAPTDYHVTKGWCNQNEFYPRVQVYQRKGSTNKSTYNHIQEIDPLIYEMILAQRRKR